MSNLDSWNSPNLVSSYNKQHSLQKPEETIFKLLKGQLRGWRMLDIGIGLGRTTIYFEPYVKEYIGIDYAYNMIKTFKKMFPGNKKNVLIKLGDVRLMDEFEANYFDLILFSYNGIDYIPQEDRMQALEEIKRVGKKDGFFVFSTHNLQYIKNLYKIKFYKNLKQLLYQFYRFFGLIYYNGFPWRYRKIDFALFNDGASHFKLTTYYIKPAAQIKQLEQKGFKNVRLFSLITGEELDKNKLNENCDDAWIYYLCEFP